MCKHNTYTDNPASTQFSNAEAEIMRLWNANSRGFSTDHLNLLSRFLSKSTPCNRAQAVLAVGECLWADCASVRTWAARYAGTVTMNPDQKGTLDHQKIVYNIDLPMIHREAMTVKEFLILRTLLSKRIVAMPGWRDRLTAALNLLGLSTTDASTWAFSRVVRQRPTPFGQENSWCNAKGKWPGPAKDPDRLGAFKYTEVTQ